MTYKYQKGVVFGNWDRFHAGHKATLNRAFELCENVLILFTKSLYHVALNRESWGIEDIGYRQNVVKDYVDNILIVTNRVSYSTYDTMDDLLSNAGIFDFEVIISGVKDRGNCWVNTYPNIVQARINAGKGEPILENVETVYMSDGQPFSSSKLRKREKLGID